MTFSPGLTRLYRSMTSVGFMRMQPCEAEWPSDARLAVPWKPTDPLNPIQRATSGLPGSPPGIVLPASAPAQLDFGTCQAGLTCLDWIVNWPSGVGKVGSPTATL